MRTRARAEQHHEERTQPREQEEKSRVRVPKIQYRFIRQLEQDGVAGQERVGALAMADKIKRYPLEAKHVMGSWERFTKRAIEDFKANKGDAAERDRTHAAYAVVFSAMREGSPAQSIGELKQRIEGLCAQRPPAPQAEERGQGRAPAPRQRSFAEVARAEERPPVERQAEAALANLRGLSPALRASIEASARELILEGHHTQASAREALPGAVRELQADPGERNTVHTLTLALIAKAPEHRALVRELGALPREQARAIEVEGRARLERYPPLETGLDDVRRDAVEAAVKSAVDITAQARREALVLAHAREELEAVADPKRLQWQSVGQELARELA